MHSPRSKRINKTFIPNQNIKGETYNHSHMNFFYKIKNTGQSIHSSRTEPNNKTINHFNQKASKTMRQSGTKNIIKNIADRSKLKSFSLPRPENEHKIKPYSKQKKQSVKDSIDFETGNLNKVIGGTPLGALSARQLIQKLEEGSFEIQNKNVQSIQYTKNIEEQDQMGTSTFYEANMIIPPPIINKVSTHRERTRRSSVNSNSSATNNKVFGFIYGGDDFLNQYREHQQNILEKVVHYRQRQIKIDFKNEWKI